MAFIPQFEDAERLQCKASIMIEGLTGKGKSGLALAIAHILAGGDWRKVFDIDTENKSTNLFVGIPLSTGGAFGKFKVGQLTADIGYKPSNYLAYREAAKQQGAAVVIEDSISHAWLYKGGVLDLVNEASKKMKTADKYGAWRDETVAAEKLNLLELIRDPQVHVITTVRIKEGFEYVAGDDGRNKIQSIGMQQIQQDDLKYEPDLVLRMIRPGSVKGNTITHPKANVIKSRYAILVEGDDYEFTPDLILQLKAYLEEGADPNELLEKQRQDYVDGIRQYLDTHSNAKAIWQVMKKDAGYEKTKLEEIPLDILKKLYVHITD